MAAVEMDRSETMTWLPISGRWSTGPSVRYLGPSEGGLTPHGLAISDRGMVGGDLSVTVDLTDAIRAGLPHSAGVVLGHTPASGAYYVVEVGGHGALACLTEFVPGSGWDPSRAVGDVDNIEPRPYRLSVTLAGQRVSVRLDGVVLFEHVLASPVAGTQTGLFAYGTGEVVFDEFVVHPSAPKAFVAMQFGEPYDGVYREVIRAIAEGRGLVVERIDERAGPGIIFEDIRRSIEDAAVVIAEITAPNQNVFYELGYAHALNKPTILLAQRGRELPFDIRSYRVIFYNDSIEGKADVEHQLDRFLQVLTGSS